MRQKTLDTRLHIKATDLQQQQLLANSDNAYILMKVCTKFDVN